MQLSDCLCVDLCAGGGGEAEGNGHEAEQEAVSTQQQAPCREPCQIPAAAAPSSACKTGLHAPWQLVNSLFALHA